MGSRFNPLRVKVLGICLVIAGTWVAFGQQSPLGTQPSHVAAPPPATEKKLVFGMTPIFDVESTQARFSPLAEHLAKQLGCQVELLVTESYDALVDRLRAGQVDLVKLSPLAYVKARKRVKDLDLLAIQVANGSKDYSSYLVALVPPKKEEQDNGDKAGNKGKKTSLSPREKLLGKKVCFADKGSTSGYLFPLAWMSRHGIDPNHDLKSVAFGGNHLECLKGLFDGRWDIAATWAGAIRAARQSGLDVGEIMFVAKTGRIPYDAWCVRPGLDPALTSKIKAELLRTNTLNQTGRRALAPTLGINGWVEVENQVYDGVQAVWDAHKPKAGDHQKP